jgi:phage tail tape-measure protein
MPRVAAPDSCDADLDGAAIGTAAGALAGAVLGPSIIDASEASESMIGALGGGFLGFWAGLAIDSRSCRLSSSYP